MNTDHRAIRTSRVAAGFRRMTDVVEDSWERSIARGLINRLEESPLAGFGAWTTSAINRSLCYRWLTEEPAPDVIVIDLRETYSVGPVITIADRAVDVFAPIWAQSGSRRAADILVAIFNVAAHSRTGQFIVALFEPPESSDRNIGE